MTCWNSQEAWKLQIVRMHSLQISNADWTHPCFGIQCFFDFRSKVRLPGHEWIWPPTWSENQRISVTHQWFVFVCSPAWLQIIDAYWCFWDILTIEAMFGLVLGLARLPYHVDSCCLSAHFSYHWILVSFHSAAVAAFTFWFSLRSATMAPCTFITFHTLVAVRWDTEKIWLGRLTGRVSREGTTSPALALNTSLWNSNNHWTIRLTTNSSTVCSRQGPVLTE